MSSSINHDNAGGQLHKLIYHILSKGAHYSNNNNNRLNANIEDVEAEEEEEEDDNRENEDRIGLYQDELRRSVSSHFRSALQLLTSTASSSSFEDGSELEIVERIKKKLVQEEDKDSAAKFARLYIKLQKSSILKNRRAILVLLLHLKDNGSSGKRIPIPHFTREYPKTHVSNVSSTPNVSNVTKVQVQPTIDSNNSSYYPPLPPKPVLISAPLTVQNPLKEVIRELIFVFQGIEGKIIIRDPNEDRFIIAPDERKKISVSVAYQISRLSELGWLFNKLHRFCQSQDSLNLNGLIGQSFVSALKDELTEYYRLLSVLEAQESSLTLSHLTVWTLEPMERMKMLASIVETCKDVKGGSLISSIYSFLHHGDPALSSTVKNILCCVCKPVYVMLLKWITDGTLEDPFNEFFIASDPKVTSDRLWEEKYSIRRTMIPKFLTLNWVKKILATGKSINYLHEVCQDSSPISGRNVVKESLDRTSPENLFQDSHNNLLHETIQRAFTDTSNHVLSVLFTRYKFLDHVTAMRKYMLLGQGDIIRYLLELLEEELNKPASSLYPHNLAGILETAIRATNAQYEDPDIIDRLDVRLLEVQPGDTGWDVFSLDYKVSGPIGTVFRSQAMTSYLMLFNALWRAKRMEWLLSYVWKRQASLHKIANQNIPELTPVLYRADLLASEMIHFIHQMAYYITFEAIECSWDQLLTHLRQAESLDEIIEAHEQFLGTLMKRALIDERSRDVLTQLRAIYDRIIEFQNIQNRLYAVAVAENEARRSRASKINSRTGQGLYGITEAEEERFNSEMKYFNKKILVDIKAQLKIVSQSYQDMVRTFLLQLTCSQDQNLQFLSFRLDFNEHYKRTDARLGTPLTFQHRRQSALDFNPE